MKKILLLSITSLAMLMADFTLEGSKLTPTNTINDTVTNPVPSPTGSAKTNWGFQPFSIPADSVTVPAGGNIQAAINSLTNGGTVNLEAGNYTVDKLLLKANLVIQGAGVGITTISSSGTYANSMIQARGAEDFNIILRDFTADCSNTDTANGIEFIYAFGGNLLLENLEVFGAAKGNITIFNNSWATASERVTFRNVNSHNARGHGMELRYVKSALVENCNSHDHLKGFGLDATRAAWLEISNFTVNNGGYGGVKFPSSKYIFIHDSSFSNCNTAGIWFQKGTDPLDGNQLQYVHIENTTINNCYAAIQEMNDANNPTDPQSFQEITLYNVTATNNATHNTARLRGCNFAYEYGANIGMTKAIVGTVNNVTKTRTPDEDGVGWTSWPVYAR